MESFFSANSSTFLGTYTFNDNSEGTGGSGNEGTDNDNDSWFSSIIDSIINLPNRILEGLATTIENITQILSYLNPLSDNFILKDLLDWLNPFSENFFVYKLIELLGDLLEFLFVPSEDVINGLVDSVKSKFSFIDTINTSVVNIEDVLQGATPAPTLTVHVNSTEFTKEQELKILDLSWYVQFKKYGDMILTGFIYAFFFWRIYIALPNIISGAGGAINDIPAQVSDIEAYRRFGFGRASSTNRRGGNQRK